MRGADVFGPGINFGVRYMTDHAVLASKVEAVRQIGYLLAYTQGGYDIAHVGHQRYLELAKEEGNKLAAEMGRPGGCILLVGVDSDLGLDLRKSTETTKRPVVPEDERAEMVAGFKPVDLVTLDTDCYLRGHERQGHSKFSLIKLLRPELVVTSQGSYTDEQVKEIEESAGRVIHVPEQAQNSTTAIIRRLHTERDGVFAQQIRIIRTQSAEQIDKSIQGLCALRDELLAAEGGVGTS